MIRGPRKKVRQLDYETGEVIEVYETITEAARDNWMEYNVLSEVLRTQNGIMRKRCLRFEYVD